jgi:hypothetical protein
MLGGRDPGRHRDEKPMTHSSLEFLKDSQYRKHNLPGSGEAGFTCWPVASGRRVFDKKPPGAREGPVLGWSQG